MQKPSRLLHLHIFLLFRNLIKDLTYNLPAAFKLIQTEVINIGYSSHRFVVFHFIFSTNEKLKLHNSSCSGNINIQKVNRNHIVTGFWFFSCLNII